MITTTNRSSIIKKLCFVSPVSEERESPSCSMECDSPPRESFLATPCGFPSAPSKHHVQRCIIISAMCVIGSNGDADSDDSSSPISITKTCRHHQLTVNQCKHRNPWNSPDNLDRKNPRLHLIPPPPPPPPRRICLASAENFDPTIFSIDIAGAPRLPNKRAMDDDKENDTQYLYTTPPSSPRWKKPRLSMKRTQQYTLEGKPCPTGEWTPNQSIMY